MSVKLICGDCLEVMAGMDDNSVDLVLTDPPYFKVKGEWWDNQWDTSQGFIEWIGQLCEQWQRILKPNGGLYVFASPKMSARVEVEIGRWFNVLNTITWRKPPYSTKAEMFKKETMRSYFPASERIIFAEHFNADNIAKGEAGYQAKCDELRGFVFEPLKQYFLEAFRISGRTKNDIIDVFRKDGRYTSEESARVHAAYKIGWGNGARWDLCDEQLYAELSKILLLPRKYDDIRKEYEKLRREYEDLRQEYEDLRRPFSVTADVPYTDVWDFPTVQAYAGKHPCEKPLAMMEHIITASTREGAVVLDCFCGSGVTGEASQNLGRDFIGIDMERKWIDFTRRRIAEAQMQPPLL